MPGSMPATSQLEWLISTTAMIVVFWSRATRDLLRSFGWGIAALHRSNGATKLPFPRRPPHSISRSPRNRQRFFKTARFNRSGMRFQRRPLCERGRRSALPRASWILTSSGSAIASASARRAWLIGRPFGLTRYRRACRSAGLNGASSAVYVNCRTCDVGRLIGSQEQYGVGHLVKFSRPAHRNDAHAFGPHGGIGGATGCAHRRHDAGMNRVGADLVLRVLHRDRFGHQPYRRL